MLDHYHSGAYGQVHQQKWSCCNAANRDFPGCQHVAAQVNGKKLPEAPTMQTEFRVKINKVQMYSFIPCCNHSMNSMTVNKLDMIHIMDSLFDVLKV